MKKIVITILILIAIPCYADFKELFPTEIKHLDFDIQEANRHKNKLDAAKRMCNGGNKINPSIAFFKNVDDACLFWDMSKNDYFDILDAGCSWYCGGGPKKVTASSFLKAQGSIGYEPQNAHDLNYGNAWVEGVKGYGVGEYLLYHFDGSAPRINKIIVVNGYVKSKKAWESNSRVKKIKMYIDDKPYAVLNLNDVRGEQHFSVELIGNGDRGDRKALNSKPDWAIKFEIADVYKGSKFDDTVISEIYFDGIDVHCLAKGTIVHLLYNKTKKIEDLRIGDKVATFDFKNRKHSTAVVERLEVVEHDELVIYRFESGNKITATKDHPFYLDGKKWCSLNPDKTKLYRGFEDIGLISIGDLFVIIDENHEINSDKLISISYLKDVRKTYTISKLSFGDNFIANGLIVGIEELEGSEF